VLDKKSVKVSQKEEGVRVLQCLMTKYDGCVVG
jgi:hypothetical protein